MPPTLTLLFLQLTGELPGNEDGFMSFPRMRIIDMSCEPANASGWRECRWLPHVCASAPHAALPGSCRLLSTVCCYNHGAAPPPAAAVNNFTGGLPPGWGMKTTVPNMELMSVCWVAACAAGPPDWVFGPACVKSLCVVPPHCAGIFAAWA